MCHSKRGWAMANNTIWRGALRATFGMVIAPIWRFEAWWGVVSLLLLALTLCGLIGTVVWGIANPNPAAPLLPRWAFFLISIGLFGVLSFGAAFRLQLYAARSRSRRANAIRRLPALRTSGVELRNEGLGLREQSQIDQWIQKCSAWRDEVNGLLNVVSPVDANLFFTLNEVPLLPFILPNSVGGEHGNQLRYLNERLKRLERVLERLASQRVADMAAFQSEATE